jgi:hypothetical protein
VVDAVWTAIQKAWTISPHAYVLLLRLDVKCVGRIAGDQIRRGAGRRGPCCHLIAMVLTGSMGHDELAQTGWTDAVP